MARNGRSPLLIALVTLLTVGVVSGDDRIANTLAVQAALRQGRTHILRGEYADAVRVLESQITRIDANTQYLSTLRDAYRGIIKTLRLEGNDEEAAVYIRRLQILDPGSAAEFGAVRSPAAAPAKAPAVPAAAAPPPVKARGKIDPAPLRPITRSAPADPFNDANRRTAHEARELLEQADQSFQARQYLKANELYARADALKADDLGEARERWAYCQMYAVVERLNSREKPVTPADCPPLEKQVRVAMTMTPKLESFGNTLLTALETRRANSRNAAAAAAVEPKLPERQAAPVAVKHSRAAGGRCALAETTNFRIFHNLSEAEAARIAQVVETTRTEMQQKWFGKVCEDWSPKCDVYIHPSADVYARETGVPGSHPGHATIASQGGRVVQRRLDMRTDYPHMTERVLPHETTHVVLAGMFGAHEVPRWADEGVAVLTEPQNAIRQHTQNLPSHRAAGHIMTVRELMEARDFPQDARRVGAFYAQSVSLVEYLTNLRGPKAFSVFLRDGLRGGYEPALREHYQINGYQDLEARWTASAFGGSADGIARNR